MILAQGRRVVANSYMPYCATSKLPNMFVVRVIDEPHLACKTISSSCFAAGGCVTQSAYLTMTGFSRPNLSLAIRFTMKSATSARATMPLRHSSGLVSTW